MSSWITQHFLNASLFWPAVLLLSVPVIIHLINRLRYRRVKFAAMEFLLASQKQSRRRILIEQLLLLLMRVALVLLVGLLVARLILNPDQLSLFQGTKAHHIIVLDDSASMRDQDDLVSAFDAGKETIRRIAAEGARHPGTQLLSVMLMSSPAKMVTGFSERIVDDSALAELSERLANLTCSHQAADPAHALEIVRERFSEERNSMRTVHVLSDFRKTHWIDNKSAASTLQDLSQASVGINLVRCVEQRHENLTLENLVGDVDVAVAGVPVSFNATVRNNGARAAADVTAQIFVDGNRIARSLDFQTIPAGQASTQRFDIVFQTAEPHTIRLTLPPDALDVDNERSIAVDVASSKPVLIVDGSPAAEQANYLADALAADQSLTGFAPQIKSAEELRRLDLTVFDLIYLVNVPEIAPDAVANLNRYVRSGGGLIWYLGDSVKPGFYNDTLFQNADGLFPAQLVSVPRESPALSDGQPSEKVSVGNDPMFQIFRQLEIPILDQVLIQAMYPVAKDSQQNPLLAKDVTVLARLGQEPLMLEHRLGAGRIFTCLTSAGPLTNSNGLNWSNWANGPASFSFVVLQLDLAKRVIRSDRIFPNLATGTPIEVQFSRTAFNSEVLFLSPNEQLNRVMAEGLNAEGRQDELTAELKDTDLPGIYEATLTDAAQKKSRRLFAVNVPPIEGNLEIADDAALLNDLPADANVRVQSAGALDWIRSESPGSEVRWSLLIAIAVLSIMEQLLAARLTHQSLKLSND